MDWFENGWGLSLIVFLPLAGALLVLLLPRKQERAAKFTALIFALASFAGSVYAAVTFDLEAELIEIVPVPRTGIIGAEPA